MRMYFKTTALSNCFSQWETDLALSVCVCLLLEENEQQIKDNEVAAYKTAQTYHERKTQNFL